MGFLGTVRSFVRKLQGGQQVARANVDPGGGANVTPYHMGAPGDDAQPLPGDVAAVIPTQRTGGFAAVAYNDPDNTGVTAAGEKRIYGRDPDGNVVNHVYLKSDGSIEISNTAGASIVLGDDGSVSINGIDFEAHTHEAGTYEAGGDPVTGESGEVA